MGQSCSPWPAVIPLACRCGRRHLAAPMLLSTLTSSINFTHDGIQKGAAAKVVQERNKGVVIHRALPVFGCRCPSFLTL
jgi:hypothetical protein